MLLNKKNKLHDYAVTFHSISLKYNFLITFTHSTLKMTDMC